MLVALELNGFKSFADKTRFEFPLGITVVVGPNGSGKSNVVDAIKWILGSQSVKSLRGKETTDVIFSGSRSRRQANAAEASLVFDNSNGHIDHSASEVVFTRRIYRSGETEYLINRQPCRLRDVRDLLSGVGIAVGAHNIIEQGKVDAVLQASPKERRLLFEEAAGVSRFRTKREEALRRMERVQQNLLRMSDIVQELDSRLKSVRSQAQRAQKYTELSTRLIELRTHAGREEWARLSRDLRQLESRLESETIARADADQRLSLSETQVATLDHTIEEAQSRLRQLSASDADVREQLAQCESTRSSHCVRIEELSEEVQRLSRQLVTLATKAGDARQLVGETAAALLDSETQLAALLGELTVRQEELKSLESQATSQDQQSGVARSRLDAIDAEIIQLEAESRIAMTQLSPLDAAAEKCEQQIAPLAEQRDRIAAHAAKAVDHLSQCSSDLAGVATQLHTAQATLAENRTTLSATHRRLAECEGRVAGVAERIAVLEELERQLDGLTSGAKQVLHRARHEPNGAFGCVRGVVAELLCVDADSAPLVEIALGERANYLVVSDATALGAALAEDSTNWTGRISFLRLDVPAPATAVDRIDLTGERGVMGRADQFVEVSAELAPMVRRLLGRYWFVDSLATALALSVGVGRGLHFVTSAGETVLADGTLTVGPRQSAAGLLSRRSELRALREQAKSLESEVEDSRSAVGRLEALVARGETAVRELLDRHASALHKHGDARLAAGTSADKLAQIEARAETLEFERRNFVEQREHLSATLAAAAERLQLLRLESDTLSKALEDATSLATQLGSRKAELQHVLADARVQQARIEQRVEGLSRQRDQLERDHAERDRTLAETRARADECREQQARLAQIVATLESESTDLAARKQDLFGKLAELDEARERLRSERSNAAAAADLIRHEVLAIQHRCQTVQIETEKMSQARATLADRLREELKFDPTTMRIDDLDSARSTAVEDRATLDKQISELREQINSTGPVNLDSLVELEALEQRHGSLARQYEDLQSARTRLEQVITQINAESRTLFADTIAEVRLHFQEIFRLLFGGGEADIILEPEADGDVLEGGISIIARPPGKQPRSISLLSGGERTLTCVAVLLAIFRSRPSPFCVLDEVDAALDESNIDRFVEVLKQFMHTTQFIVITHSKRTMSATDTLYGVTMQEAGVSKRVSVRFEDVGEDGRIRPAALASSPPASRAA